MASLPADFFESPKQKKRNRKEPTAPSQKKLKLSHPTCNISAAATATVTVSTSSSVARISASPSTTEMEYDCTTSLTSCYVFLQFLMLFMLCVELLYEISSRKLTRPSSNRNQCPRILKGPMSKMTNKSRMPSTLFLYDCH